MKHAFPEPDKVYGIYQMDEARIKGFLPMFGAMFKDDEMSLVIVRRGDQTNVCTPSEAQTAWDQPELPGEPIVIHRNAMPDVGSAFAASIVIGDEEVMILRTYMRVGTALGILDQPDQPESTTD